METTENQKTIEAETITITNEHEKIQVKVQMQKEHFETTRAYAEMIQMEHGRLLEEILNSGVKSIRTHLSNLPHTTMRKVLKQYNVPQNIVDQLTPVGC
jgi:hypothetical protein